MPLYTLYCTCYCLIVNGQITIHWTSFVNLCVWCWSKCVYLPLRGERCRWCVSTDTIAVTLQETAQVRKRALLEVHTKRPVPSHQLPARHIIHIQSCQENNVKWTSLNNGKRKCDCINTLVVKLTPDGAIRVLICMTNMKMFPVDSNSFQDKLLLFWV